MSAKVKLVLDKPWDYTQCIKLLSQHHEHDPAHNRAHNHVHNQAHNPSLAHSQFLIRTYYLDTRGHGLRQVYATLPRLRAVSPLNMITSSSPVNPGGTNVNELRVMSPALDQAAVSHPVAQNIFDKLVAYAATQAVSFPTNIPVLDEICGQLGITELFVVGSYTCVRKVFRVAGTTLELDKFTIKNHDGHQLQFQVPEDKEVTKKILGMLDNAGVTYSVTAIPKWGRLLEEEGATGEPIYCSCPEAQGGLCVNTPRPSVLLSSLSKLLHTILMNHIPYHSVAKALSPPSHSSSSLEELPSTSLGTHLLSGPMFDSQPFEALIPEEDPAVFDMEDLDLHFAVPETKAQPVFDHYLADTKFLSLSDSPFDFGAHSMAAPSMTSMTGNPSGPIRPVPQKPTPRAIKKKKADVKVEFSPMPSRQTTPMSSPPGLTSPEVSKAALPGADDLADAIALQKKRSCEASARYRRKKQKEEDQTKEQVATLTTEKQQLSKMIEQLQAQLRAVETENVVLKAKLEVYEQKRSS